MVVDNTGVGPHSWSTTTGGGVHGGLGHGSTTVVPGGPVLLMNTDGRH